ncbi:MAG: mechanosensitive ion channel [Bacteroidetes bacterium]|nr:mechanosensitive ion channel [Bacteroidota bacterium]
MKIFVAFLLALLLFLSFRLFRIGLKRLADLYACWNFRINFLFAFELVIWLVYVFWATAYLFAGKFYYNYLVIGLIFVLVGLISWYLLRDLIAGVIFKTRHNLKPGANIIAGAYAGMLKSQHTTYITIRAENGMLLRVPYSKLNQEVIAEIAQNNAGESHKVQLQLENGMDKNQGELFIRQAILNLPWSSLKEEPSIRWIGLSGEYHVFEVMLYSVDKNRMKHIELALAITDGLRVVAGDKV